MKTKFHACFLRSFNVEENTYTRNFPRVLFILSWGDIMATKSIDIRVVL